MRASATSETQLLLSVFFKFRINLHGWRKLLRHIRTTYSEGKPRPILPGSVTSHLNFMTCFSWMPVASFQVLLKGHAKIGWSAEGTGLAMLVSICHRQSCPIGKFNGIFLWRCHCSFSHIHMHNAFVFLCQLAECVIIPHSLLWACHDF